ncbi:hypothetical protein [Mangrovimonas cancribranchiae]|uniref:Sugar transporter n=1 Tax=Mangrovimonas cancribranchiae TaxID=3080055 RepID=A0AAU6P136_9FLAO
MTTKSTTSKPPIWYWIIAVIALIWNAMGVMQYLGQAYNTEAWRSGYTEEQLNIINSMPAWYTAVFAIAVFSGVLGCLALFIRKIIAKLLFWVSLLAVLIQMGYSFAEGHLDNMGMTTAIVVFAIFLVWFSQYASRKQWIS